MINHFLYNHMFVDCFNDGLGMNEVFQNSIVVIVDMAEILAQ